MLTVYKPEYSDLWFRQLMLSDAKTMSYNHAWGGTIPFPEEQWREWHERWVINTEGKRYYRYLKNEAGKFVGEIAYHYDAETDGYMADVIICSEYRRRGYGSQALDMLCSAAREGGVSTLYDDIAIDNPAIRLFLSHGFSVEYQTEETILFKKEL